jgi:ubiquinone/menaquinone biosynthesis C-methylase UbiE
MSNRFDKYAARQKSFWNVTDINSAKFARIDLVSKKTEDAWHASAAEASKMLLQGINPQPDWTVLEIGCGVGRIISILREITPCRQFIGVDISENMIDFAKNQIGDDNKVSLFVNNGYNLALVDSNFVDFAYSIDVFIHIYDVDIASSYLRDICRVLKKDGIFRFNVRRFDPGQAFSNSIGGFFAKAMYNLGIWSTAKHRWDIGQPAEFNGNQYMPRDIKKLVNNSGLSIRDIQIEESVIWCILQK